MPFAGIREIDSLHHRRSVEDINNLFTPALVSILTGSVFARTLEAMSIVDHSAIGSKIQSTNSRS